jgi:predicted NUDIX family NTP pyrophosphohydrolase
MRGFDRVIQVLSVLMLLLSLGSAPVVAALTHGAGTLAAEADHAAWHAEKGEVLQADTHQHHDSTDHDHSTSVILTLQETAVFDMRTAAEFGDLPVLSGATRDGPRRPPRETV